MITLGEQAQQALRVVREAPVIAYDTETSGVDWKRNSVVGYVITANHSANYYIPVRHGGGGNLLDPHCGPLSAPDDRTVAHSFEIELQRAFEHRRRMGYLTVGHHLLFDMQMSANHGVDLGRNCECTQNNAAMLDEYMRSFSLESCAAKAGVTAKKGDALYARLAELFGGKAERSQMGNYWRLPGNDPAAVEYAIGDGITTLELRNWQHKGIEAEELGLIHGIESRLIRTVFRMGRRGIKVDEEYIGQLIEAIAQETIEAEKKLPARFNSRAPSQVRALMESLGHTNWPMTAPSKNFPNGQPSFTEKWLKTNDAGKAIIKLRQLTNLMNTFVTPLKERHIHNGRVHAELHQLKSDEYGVVAGRFSCSDPNLQAIHKRNKELGRKFRRIFVADDGMEFWEGDYKQMEPCLFAHYSKDRALVEGYNAVPPRDVHQLVADAFGCERDPTAKRMNMGILTGMQPKTFAGHMGWTLEEATTQWNKWFATFPGVRDFQKLAKDVFRGSGYVRTILKRRCHLDNPQYAYRGTSRIIQGSNADIVKERLLKCDEALEAAGDPLHLLMTVHDSFEWQADRGEAGEKLSREIVREFCDLQSPPFNMRVPVGMDVGHGPDWATATYGPLPAGTLSGSQAA